jgi:hypothetical protein
MDNYTMEKRPIKIRYVEMPTEVSMVSSPTHSKKSSGRRNYRR